MTISSFTDPQLEEKAQDLQRKYFKTNNPRTTNPDSKYFGYLQRRAPNKKSHRCPKTARTNGTQTEKILTV